MVEGGSAGRQKTLIAQLNHSLGLHRFHLLVGNEFSRKKNGRERGVSKGSIYTTNNCIEGYKKVYVLREQGGCFLELSDGDQPGHQGRWPDTELECSLWIKLKGGTLGDALVQLQKCGRNVLL